ncbi:hypothetical protein [Streptomyces sp. MZ04]|uniref:hypothetical protein n=1 Tax=Streptomyces sp. MZ04 TaxID=2559236 RepID=UPI00107EC594|nr:hypothetical protein [Streptomyces sp. MZ04]TGB08408.1 hypothetical protein E2651_19250 [Streptomyces sp. MZ04]
MGNADRGRKSAAAVSVAVLLMAAAGCGDDKGSDSAGAEPLTQAKLSSAALGQGDVQGYTIREISANGGDSVKAARKPCQPIVNAIYPEASAYDKRLAGRSINKTTEGSQKPTAAYRLVLSSAKSESAAEQSVQDLKKAISACGSGFETKPSGLISKIRTVSENKSGLGDDGVDFSLEYQIDRKVRYVVTQNGTSLTSISAETEFARKFVPVPQEILDAQEKKLNKAADAAK